MAPKPKPPKKLTHGKLIEKAHSVLREIVLLRDGGCVCPPPKLGHSKVLQAGHIIRALKGGSRFSLWNVHVQCKSCNRRHVDDWQVYEGWFIDKFGHAQWDNARAESLNEGLKSYEIEEIIVQLNLIHEKQKSDPSFKPYYTQTEILSGAWNNEKTKEPTT